MSTWQCVISYSIHHLRLLWFCRYPIVKVTSLPCKPLFFSSSLKHRLSQIFLPPLPNITLCLDKSLLGRTGTPRTLMVSSKWLCPPHMTICPILQPDRTPIIYGPLVPFTFYDVAIVWLHALHFVLHHGKLRHLWSRGSYNVKAPINMPLFTTLHPIDPTFQVRQLLTRTSWCVQHAIPWRTWYWTT